MKLSAKPVSDTKFASEIVVSSLGNDAVTALLRQLQSLTAPLVSSGRLDSRLQDLITELSAGLAKSVRAGSSAEDVTGIITPKDECDYWADRANDYNLDSEEIDRAKVYSAEFSKIARGWGDLDQATFSELQDLLEQTMDTLDAVWKATPPGDLYPQSRMEQMLRVVGAAVVRKIQANFPGTSVWSTDFKSVKTQVKEGKKACERWAEIVKELTQSTWRTDRVWSGAVTKDEGVLLLAMRLQEVYSLRAQSEELLRLLTTEERQRFQVERAFEPFTRVPALLVSQFSLPAWQEAKSRYDAALQPVEDEIVGKLRQELMKPQVASQQVREFQKWQGLLSRPYTQRALQSEREVLLSQLNAETDSLRGEFAASQVPSEPGMSPVVSSVVWARQLQQKSMRIIRTLESLLADLATSRQLTEAVRGLVKDLKDFQLSQFKVWATDVKAALQDKQISLELTGRLMVIDYEEGHLKVNISDRLSAFLKETRQLAEFGFKVPKEYLKVAQQAKKFYKEGLALKQVAHFYNSMSSQIMEAQRPMMQDVTKDFEDVVKTVIDERRQVVWKSPSDVEAYVHRVQAAATALTNENRRLRKAHFAITEMIGELANIDLLRHRQMWKEKLDEVRTQVSKVADSKSSPEVSVLWRASLDRELFRALEVQYRQGLEHLSENLPDFKADLVFTNKQINFRPPLEELKQRYYREIRVFISIPMNFQGLGGNPDIYRKMPDKNANCLVHVFTKAEELFNDLKAFLRSYAPWTVLGSIDLDSLIEQHVKTVRDVENNLKLLKQKRKELDKLQNAHKIHCFEVSFVPFKTSIEDQLQRLSDALVLSLKTSLKNEVDQLDKFLETAKEKLARRPVSAEEIAQAQLDALEVSKLRASQEAVYAQLLDKTKLLRQLTGAAPHIGGIQEKWEQLQSSLNDYGDVIEQQRDVVRQDLHKKTSDLNAALDKFAARWSAQKPKPIDQLDLASANEQFERVREWRADWQDMKDRMETLKKDCLLFDVPSPNFSASGLEAEIAEHERAWTAFEEFRTELDSMGKEDWLSFRSKLYNFQDFFMLWAEKLKGREKDVVAKFIGAQLELFKQAWPVLKLSTGEGFEKEHWKSLFHYLKLSKEVTMENLQFSHFLDNMGLLVKASDQVKELQARAQGEVTIREAIQELRVWCEDTLFTLTEHVSGDRTTPLVKEWKELLTQLSDNQALLASLKESRFFPRFADQIEQFEGKLTALEDYLAKLNSIQRKWVYLEPIFGRGALPHEQARFKRVDDEYRNIMLGIGADSRVVSLCNIVGLKDTLETLVDQLERCQKALNDFLEEKRAKFPRFYFIGDDDLLEILGQAKKPAVIQTHLKKLFAGIFRVEFEGSKIVAMLSAAGEKVVLRTPIAVNDEVETWLGELAREMQRTLSADLVRSLQIVQDTSRLLAEQPSQLCTLAEMVSFSAKTTSAITRGNLDPVLEELKAKLADLTSRRGDALQLLKTKSLVLDVIHNLEVVETLKTIGVRSPADWEWLRQLKYAMQGDQAEILMSNAKFEYTYEYQGNAPRLVHTPLTDKCYLTLTQGMMLGYGGNPYGPAGTGKTESVKALGQAFGRQVLVFNCDEGIDFKSMGRIFIGLVKCGAWGCFDEFNRLLEEQLSAISQQIQTIQWAIKNKERSLALLGRNIEVNLNAGIFVTLNPAGKGYGGRSKLPDNLKMLFRPVAMSVPDNELIAEVLLYAEGFRTAKALGFKVVQLFSLAKQLLSSQEHYDWGLRALKTTLTIGGQLMQVERTGGRISEEREAVILIKAIRINTLPKLTYPDLKHFIPLVADIFQGASIEDIQYQELEAALRQALEEAHLAHSDSQTAKMLQFHEATRQRMGVVLVGPSGCGKSTIWRLVQQAYEKLGTQMSVHVMNPKSMPREKLLGRMDVDTREWSDGVLTAAARECVRQPPETRCWIVCDGDIDPQWVESLNSVLDDNHLLTLPTGERISFGDNVNFIFETNDLRYASPATVSRMGMIFMSEEDVDVDRLVSSWLRRQSEEVQRQLGPWIQDLFSGALSWALSHSEEMNVKTTKVGTVTSALSLLSQATSKAEFVACLVRGLGANFPYELRAKFASEVFGRARESPADQRAPLDCFYSAGAFKPYTSQDEAYTPQDFADPTSPPLVRTKGIQRDIDLFQGWLEAGDPFILVGPEGCGKSLMLRSAFKRLKSAQVASLHCNAQTTAVNVLQKLLQICAQSTSGQGRVLRPRDSQRLILYLKDINLPTPDQYNTIQLIAFLQQLVTYKGFYDDNLEFVYLERIQIVASMNPSTTVGRHELSPRFTANVRLACVDYPDREELTHVYSQYFKTVLGTPGLGKQTSLATKLAQCTVDLYAGVKAKFSVDDHRHYSFTPREVTQLCIGLLRYEARDQRTLVEAWGHEAARTFRDRLVSREDYGQFDVLLTSQLRQQLGYAEAITGFFTTWGASSEVVVRGLPAMTKMTQTEFASVVSQGLLAYEREFRELKFHLFDESQQNLARLNRVLSRTGGNVLLVGESGVGRRTAVQLVSHMLNYAFVTLNITREYSLKDFRKDLKVVLQQAGVEGRTTVLFIEEHMILESSFIQLLNSLLSAGEVPGLYAPEEIEPLLGSIADTMRQEGRFRTLYEFFVARVQRNLRIVISLDHEHPNYASHCSNNPALFTCCSILWLQPWVKESLTLVSGIELRETLQDQSDSAELIELGIAMHKSVEGATQRHFMDFIVNFIGVFADKNKSQGGQSSHLSKGLGKLREAESLVDSLSKKAHEQQKLLALKQKEADEALKQISEAMSQAAERRQEVETLQVSLTEENVIINKRKDEVERELADIQPLVDSAQRAVGSIRKDHLNELKALRMPPEPVSDVLSAVLRLMGNSDTSWVAMKRFLSEGSVVPNIVNFNPRRITPEIRADINQHVNRHASSFEPAVISRASQAAAPMATWVTSLLQYSEILERIQPLENDLHKSIAKLETSQKRLIECEEQLDRLDNLVIKLKADFGQRTSEAETLKRDLAVAEDTLTSAQSLLGKLAGEKKRWEIQLKSMNEDLRLLPRHSLLSAGFVTYLSFYSEDRRESMVKQWKDAVGSGDYQFLRFMASESDMLRWKAEGLPGDSLSSENAVVIFSSRKTSLVIDPSTKATGWLKSQGNNEVLSQQDPRFSTQLELAVRFGKSLIIQEVDRVEPLLFPLLRKDLVKQGPRWVVQIGEKQIDYSETFRLFLCTRDSSIELPPNAAAVITPVNFTVTRSGLEGQLLSLILNHEQPDLEQRKTELLAKEERLKVQLADLEKQLLEQLATAEGNILENKGLVESLNKTKSSSQEIGVSLAESHELQASVDSQREVYRALAVKGSTMYTLLQDLRKVNHMYQFSLSSFFKQFSKALDTPVSAADVADKLGQLLDALTVIVFMNVSSSLFKADRLMFGLHFLKHCKSELFERHEWELLKGEVAAHGDVRQFFPSWANPDRRDEFGLLGATLTRLVSTLNLDNESLWGPWANSAECEREFPGAVQSKLSPFQALLIVKVLRPDRLESAMHVFVQQGLSTKDTAPPPLSFARLLQETTSSEPVLFLVSPGSDPSKELEEFAEQTVGRDRFHDMAMGGGQNDTALQLLRDSAHKGDWVCLKNLHLVTSWLPTLEKELKVLKPHAHFRLWLTTEAHSKFPSILLQSSLKITFESPPGVKKNLLRTYQSFPENFLEQASVQKAQVIFAMSAFHAIVQERRTYIPQGWSKFYEFSQADLRTGSALLDQLMQGRDLPWNALRGLLDMAVYGGRIDNEFDSKVLKSYLLQFFSPETLSRKKLPGGFRLPESNSLRDYLKVIEALPEQDSHDLFGLPANIGRSVQRYNSLNVIRQLKQLSAVSEDSLKFDREEWSAKLGPLWALWQSMFRPELLRLKGSAADSQDPLESFVSREAVSACQLLESVHSSLEGISKVLAGTGMMTSAVEQDARHLLINEVPATWAYVWEGPSSPVPWLRTLVRRTGALKQWVELARSGTLFNQPLNLGELFHPQTFLNAYRQLTARRLKRSMEDFKLTCSLDSSLQGSIQLTGLSLQGACFTRGRLTNAEASSPDLTPLPNIAIAWVPHDQTEAAQDSVVVPVYLSPEREGLLCTLKLMNSGTAEERVISGVALFLSGSEE
jgi:dynein heavy chain 2